MIIFNRLLEKSLLFSFRKQNLSSLQLQTSSDVEPVNMSYVSYERTEYTRQPPPLIIMHDIFGSKANWTGISKALHRTTQPPRKIIAVDSRNHGDSPHSPYHTCEHMAEDIIQFIRTMNLSKAALMGHSMGGRTVLYTALKYPDSVQKLISVEMSPVSTSPKFRTISAILTAMRNVRFPNRVSLASARISADLQLSRVVNSRLVRNSLLANIQQDEKKGFNWRINIPALLRSESLFTFPPVNGLTFNGPTLFIAGCLSDYIQKVDEPRILKFFPNAKFKYIENAGHWVYSQKQREFLKICTDFLNKDEPEY